MSITEYERHLINQWLEVTMGPERPAIMMQLLPPVGWGDIATKADLQVLRSELRGEMAELRGDMRMLGADLREQQAATLRAMVVTMVASHATLVGLVIAAVNLG